MGLRSSYGESTWHCDRVVDYQAGFASNGIMRRSGEGKRGA